VATTIPSDDSRRARVELAHAHTDALAATLAAVAREGHDLADLLSAALARVAVELGSVEALTAARPGSWEAGHVEALAGPARYELDVRAGSRAGGA
jgi:hypothetical protein